MKIETAYNMIFKRKSFHHFKGEEKLTSEELSAIQDYIEQLIPMDPDIDVVFRLMPREQSTCRIGEYAILIYSERKGDYLTNVGYMGEQLDLWLTSQNIGVCWYGMAKAKELEHNGLDFIIMMAIEKCAPNEFRTAGTKIKRKTADRIWKGKKHTEIAESVRLAPSAINGQPWLVEEIPEGLLVYRDSRKRGIMTKKMAAFYHQIDIGIFMYILEVCLDNAKIKYRREKSLEKSLDELYPVACYRI